MRLQDGWSPFSSSPNGVRCVSRYDNALKQVYFTNHLNPSKKRLFSSPLSNPRKVRSFKSKTLASKLRRQYYSESPKKACSKIIEPLKLTSISTLDAPIEDAFAIAESPNGTRFACIVNLEEEDKSGVYIYHYIKKSIVFLGNVINTHDRSDECAALTWCGTDEIVVSGNRGNLVVFNTSTKKEISRHVLYSEGGRISELYWTRKAVAKFLFYKHRDTATCGFLEEKELFCSRPHGGYKSQYQCHYNLDIQQLAMNDKGDIIFLNGNSTSQLQLHLWPASFKFPVIVFSDSEHVFADQSRGFKNLNLIWYNDTHFLVCSDLLLVMLKIKKDNTAIIEQSFSPDQHKLDCFLLDVALNTTDETLYVMCMRYTDLAAMKETGSKDFFSQIAVLKYCLEKRKFAVIYSPSDGITHDIFKMFHCAVRNCLITVESEEEIVFWEIQNTDKKIMPSSRRSEAHKEESLNCKLHELSIR